MLKSLFAISKQRYPSVARVATVFIFIASWLTILVTGNSRLPLYINLFGFTPFCILCFIFVARYYVQFVLTLCLFHITFITFACSYFYLLNTSGLFFATLFDIALAGLLLGGGGATIVTSYEIVLLIAGEWTIANHIFRAPPRVYSEPRAADYVIYVIVSILIILSIYVVVSFFSRVVQDTLSRLSRRSDELAEALQTVEQGRELQRQTGNQIVAVMGQLSSVAHEQLSSVQEQAAALAQVSATIEELSQTAMNIAEAAGTVELAVEDALESVSTSQGAVNDSLGAMISIKAQVQEIVNRTLALNERIGQINDVNGIVANIAAQTHLLALNAAIEAAGAGLEGERFATVATEVKKLAGRAQSEATQIRTLVNELGRANSASVMSTENGLKESDKGADRARRAADANADVIERIGLAADRAKAIALSTQQQRSASQQVVETIRQLKQGSQGIASTAQTLNASINELSALAQQLGAMMDAKPMKGHAAYLNQP